MRCRLRTLLILTAAGPPILAALRLMFSPQVAYELAGMAIGTTLLGLRYVLVIVGGCYAIAWGVYFIRYSVWYVVDLWWRFHNWD